MNKNNKLIIFSYEYPFGQTETFLDNEIKILADTFPEIVIVPSRIVWNNGLTYNNIRSLPRNVSVCKDSYTFKFFDFHVFSSLIKRQIKSFLKFKIKDCFTIVKQSFKASILVGFLKSNQLVNFQSVYYSYWKNESATAISFLKMNNDIAFAFTRAHREDLYNEFFPYGIKPFDHFVNQNIDKVFCISDHGKEYLLDKGFDKEKVKVSKLGVFPTNVCTLYSFEGFNILSVSHVVPVKRVALIAKAVLQLKMKVRWVHIGGGPELEMLQNIIKSSNQEHITIELLGSKSHDYVYEYYRNNPVDLFLNVSSSEGLPVSIMEAYSFSVPCMACDVGGNAEIIDPGSNFLLSPQINENDLSQAITTFYDQKNLWKKYRESAFQIWKEEYNAIDNYRDFSRALLGDKC